MSCLGTGRLLVTWTKSSKSICFQQPFKGIALDNLECSVCMRSHLQAVEAEPLHRAMRPPQDRSHQSERRSYVMHIMHFFRMWSGCLMMTITHGRAF